MYVQRLLDEAKKNLCDSDMIKLKLSNSWIDCFKNIYKLRFRSVHGEALSSNHKAIREGMLHICCIIMTCTEKYVWNEDEFGLFFRQPLN